MNVGKKKKRENRAIKPDEPPMTSMIDIIFQLLVFFILTMQIQSVEGKLINQLPKTHGPGPGAAMEDLEIRIILCCGEGIRHQKDKGQHEARFEVEEQADRAQTKSGDHSAHLVLNDICSAWVANYPLGKLYKTWLCRKGHLEENRLDASQRVSENVERYGKIAARAKELHDATPSRQDPNKQAPVILDMDSAVPYEHIIGVINALKDLGIHNIEFVANSRHNRYYGSDQKGQFDTYRQQVK